MAAGAAGCPDRYGNPTCFVWCVRETEILVEQQPPQGVFVCDHAGRVINKFSLFGVRSLGSGVNFMFIGCTVWVAGFGMSGVGCRVSDGGRQV